MICKLFKSLSELVVGGSIIAILLSGCASSRSSSQAEASLFITTNSTEITETAAVSNQPANTSNSENTSASSNTTTKVTVGTPPSSSSVTSANATSKPTTASSTLTTPTGKATTQPPASSIKTSPTAASTTPSTPTTTTQLTHDVTYIQSSIISELQDASIYDPSATGVGGSGYADYPYDWSDDEIIWSMVDALSQSRGAIISISVVDTGSEIRVNRTQ